MKFFLPFLLGIITAFCSVYLCSAFVMLDWSVVELLTPDGRGVMVVSSVLLSVFTTIVCGCVLERDNES